MRKNVGILAISKLLANIVTGKCIAQRVSHLQELCTVFCILAFEVTESEARVKRCTSHMPNLIAELST